MINSPYQYNPEPFTLTIKTFGDGYSYTISFVYNGQTYTGTGTAPTPEQASDNAFDYYWKIIKE